MEMARHANRDGTENQGFNISQTAIRSVTEVEIRYKILPSFCTRRENRKKRRELREQALLLHDVCPIPSTALQTALATDRSSIKQLAKKKRQKARETQTNYK